MQSCTSSKRMSLSFSPVSSSTSRRRASSERSFGLILPPGMPHLWLHLWVWIISTSPCALKISAPTVGMGGCVRDAAMPIEEIAHLAQVAEEQVGVRALQLCQRIVAGQHGATDHARMTRRLDIVHHVADEDRLGGVEIVLGQQMQDDLPLVERLHVGLLEILLHVEPAALRLEMLAVDGAEQEGRHFARLEVIEKIERMRQRRNAGLQDLERGMVVVVELGQLQLGQVLLVEVGEREIELFPEFLRGENGLAVNA